MGFLGIFLTILITWTPTAFAQNPLPSTTTYNLPTSVSPTSPLYTDLLIHNLFHSFSCLSIGQSVIGQPCLTYQLTKNAQGMIQGVPVLSQVDTSGGVLGTTTSLIGMLFTNPPVRSADYLASVGKDLGIVKEAQAQVVGSGQAVLNPILGLWTVSRNISYIIMIIIFVIIGLMVMFRTKINPQTVITAQAALPGLVLGLIMITFSYFFAGLISDMAFVGTNIVGYYFSAVRGQTNPPQDLVNDISTQNILTTFGKFVSIIDQSKANQVGQIIFDNVGPDAQTNIRLLVSFLTMQFFAPIANGLGNITTAVGTYIPPLAPAQWVGVILGPATTALSGIGGALAPALMLSFMLFFIATLALIYQMIKLLLRLINSYLTIIFLTISAPFQFLFASLPGRQGIATGWILNMLANILVFPAVLAILYFVAFLLAPTPRDKYAPFIVSSQQTQPSSLIPAAYAEDQIKVVGRDTFPLFGGLDLSVIEILLSFGALMALPAIPDLVVKSVGRMGQAGQLIGQEIGGGIGQGRQYAGQFQGAASGVGAQVGGMMGESAYTVIDYDTAGRPVYGLNPLSSRANIIQKVQARQQVIGGSRKVYGLQKS